MNKNKLIAAIIWGVLVVLLVIWLTMLEWSSNAKKQPTKSEKGTFSIWIYWDSVSSFQAFLSAFKEKNKNLSQLDFNVVSFNDPTDYFESLSLAFFKGQAPDMFVLDNNENSLFEEKTLLLPPEVVNVSKFREEYHTLFSDDLIITVPTTDWWSAEYIKGLPIGYETLGIVYNRRSWFKAPDMNSLSGIRSAISRIWSAKINPMALGNGSTVVDSWDILAQFLLLNKVYGLAWADEAKVKQALGEYTMFGNTQWENAYNDLFVETKTSGKTNIDLLLEWSVWATVMYPRNIKQLEWKTSLKNTLFAAPFPHTYGWDGPSLARYQTFVVNSSTAQLNTAYSLLSYMNSDEGALLYHDLHPYYLPARVNLEEELSSKRISNFFSALTLWDFYSIEPLASFNKSSKAFYDTWINTVLDDFANYLDSFKTFQNYTLCKQSKVLTLSNLWQSCE